MNDEGRILAVVAIIVVVLAAGYFIFGWTGISRCASDWTARTVGADWIVVQFDFAGEPFRCWELEDTSISNEANSDGIYWQNPSGNMIHLSGFHLRAQVVDEKWQEAFDDLGLTRELCRRVREAHKPPHPNWPNPGQCPPCEPPPCPEREGL